MDVCLPLPDSIHQLDLLGASPNFASDTAQMEPWAASLMYPMTHVRSMAGPVQDHCLPLHLAAQHGSIGVATILCTSGAAVNAKDKKGFTPLHHAVQAGHEDLVTELVQRQADIDARTEVPPVARLE